MTDLPAWSEIASDRERDALVAIHVMGGKGPVFTVYAWHDRKARQHPVLSLHDEAPGEMWRDFSTFVDADGNKLGRDGVYANFPRYTTDIAADYSVLEHVRKTWTPRQLRDLWYNLADAMQPRLTRGLNEREWPIFYQPGDYSMAAYLTIRATKQGEPARV